MQEIKIKCLHSIRKLGVVLLMTMVTFAFCGGGRPHPPLLQRQTPPKFPRMVILDSSLPKLLPIFRGNFTHTLWPEDLYATVRDHTRF